MTGVEVEAAAVVDLDVDVGVDSDVDAKMGGNLGVDIVEATGAVVTPRTTRASVVAVGVDVEVEVDVEAVGWDVDV
jgi:hypothetical protein